MDIEDLEDRVKKLIPLTEHKHYLTSETHSDWLKRRAAEDAFLIKLQCPECGKDVRIAAVEGVTHYYCSANAMHKFIRASSLITGVVGEPIKRADVDDNLGYQWWD